MQQLQKLKKGDKVAIVSPSSAAPSYWPEVYELGLTRLRDIFGLEPVEFPTTRTPAKGEERARDLAAAFEDPSIKAVIATLGGDDQVTYIHRMNPEPFANHPKPYFGFSDSTHFMNFLWLCGVPSYYGGSILTQFAMQKEMDSFTVDYLKRAFFEEGEYELDFSDIYNDIGLDWGDVSNLNKKRFYESNEGWYWNGAGEVRGITWGGCLESINEMLQQGIHIPPLESFTGIVLMTETSEGIPSSEYVRNVYRSLGERGILSKVQAIVVGRPQAWSFDNQQNTEQKNAYREEQRNSIIEIVRDYAPNIPIVQNLDFGHTDPQIPMPYGMPIHIETAKKKISITF